MRILLKTVLCTAFIATGAAWADSDTTTSTTRESDVSNGYLRDEVVGIKPLVGILSFSDVAGNNTTRGAAGAQLDMNFAASGPLYLGIQTGGIYSHIGSSNANFFGSSDATGSPAGSLLIIPANLKVGVNATDQLRLSAHGGGNFLYRSVVGAVPTGDTGVFGSTNWGLLPNLGGELELGIGRNVALSLRPDWTIAPGNDILSATLALGIGLG